MACFLLFTAGQNACNFWDIIPNHDNRTLTWVLKRLKELVMEISKQSGWSFENEHLVLGRMMRKPFCFHFWSVQLWYSSKLFTWSCVDWLIFHSVASFLDEILLLLYHYFHDKHSDKFHLLVPPDQTFTNTAHHATYMEPNHSNSSVFQMKG